MYVSHSVIGYVSPRHRLDRRDEAIWHKRQQKLAQARLAHAGHQMRQHQLGPALAATSKTAIDGHYFQLLSPWFLLCVAALDAAVTLSQH